MTKTRDKKEAGMQKERYVKFRAEWDNTPVEADHLLMKHINRVRSELIARGWLGSLPDGTGFGNISLRPDETGKFLITGSKTGHLKQLGAQHISSVEKTDITNNRLFCRGLTIASSEALSHAACYRSNPHINAVIHIHSRELWLNYLNKIPTTDQNAVFGTPAIALSIARIVKKRIANYGLIVMGGHPDGLIAYGKNLKTAVTILIRAHNDIRR
ncbi:MAG: class II aldolase/adducin family protein [Fidelibacterota bacterium]